MIAFDIFHLLLQNLKKWCWLILKYFALLCAYYACNLLIPLSAK
jgi:hypothetical protein